jgi:signal transduction histidine kinase/ligand-binding sensor domain-containing protein/DNA-binding response OmpR family regulator
MHFKIKHIIFISLFVFMTERINAEYNCIFEHLSTEDGLSHSRVSGMLKDSKGFMWFATWDGINRYDGHTFKTFKPGNDIASMPASSRIKTMKEDALGNIWVITYDSKAYRLNRKSEVFESVPKSINDSTSFTIENIIPLSSGNVWLTTDNHGALQVISDTLTNTFRTIHHNTKSNIKLLSNNVSSVTRDHEATIWINTSKGMVVIPNKKNSTAPQKEVLKQINQYSITKLFQTSSLLYFGTKSGKLLALNLNSNKIEIIKLSNQAPVSTITSNNSGTIIIGTSGKGVFLYDEYTKQLSTHYNYPDIHNVLTIYSDSKGLLWIESSNPGITKINPQTGQYKHFEQELVVNQDVRNGAQCGIMEDKSKTVWLTLKGGGFGYYNNETDNVEYFFNNTTDPERKLSNFVNCFYVDPSGVLWMSTYFKGIEKITFIDEKFELFQPVQGAERGVKNEVRSVMEDSEGLLWVATKNQELFILNQENQILKEIDSFNDKPIGRIYAMLEDSRGNIFLGSKGNGLFMLTRRDKFRFDAKHYQHNDSDLHSLSNNNIYTIFEDRQKRIWIGTYGGGINLFHKELFLNQNNSINNYPGNKGQKVRHITEDKNGNIWIGTTDGIIILPAHKQTTPDDFEFNLYNNEKDNIEGLRGNDIFWIYNDKDNNIWVASLGGGLAKLSTKSSSFQKLIFSSFTKKDGLPSDVIFTITPGSNNNLWMATENGISRYNHQRNTFRNFNQYDGIINSGFSEASVTKRNDGNICMGANNGIYCFDPSDFINDQKKMDIFFTNFNLFGKEVKPGTKSPLSKSITETNNIKLESHQNVFSITWTALNFRMQNKTQYAYMLEGYDEHWRFAGVQNQAYFNKIPHGNYIFKVKLSDPEISSINQPKTLRIEILPPFWKTTWAYIIYTIIAIALVEAARRIIITMIKLRNKVIIEREITNEKLNFFTNISHELRTPLTLILNPAKEIRNNENLSKKGKVYSELIEQNAQRLLRTVNHLLDYRKIQSNKMSFTLKETDIVRITKNACQNFAETAREKNIQFDVKTPDKPVNAHVDEEKIDSVIFNLLSNAFKFTPNSGIITVTIERNNTPDSIDIVVSDTGFGITKEQEKDLFKLYSSNNHNKSNIAGTGIGLSLSKELMQIQNGNLLYRSTPGGGATFIIHINNEQQKNNTIHKTETATYFNPKTQVETTPDLHSKSKTERAKILIVEDNNDLRHLLTTRLKDEFNTYEAQNGEAGLTLAGKIQPDIILSDVMMPEMDGIQMLDNLKNNFETSHIPVILLTAKSSVESKVKGLKYGADAYITKPFHTDQLIAQIENLLHQRILLRKKFSEGTTTLNTIKNDKLITDSDAEFIKKVIGIIKQNLTNTEFRTKNIYRETGMGRSKFYDKIKGLTGLSPIDFIKEYRLNKALQLINTGKYNISETALMTGFSDAGYFSKCFKEHFGKSPSAVKKNQ